MENMSLQIYVAGIYVITSFTNNIFEQHKGFTETYINYFRLKVDNLIKHGLINNSQMVVM